MNVKVTNLSETATFRGQRGQITAFNAGGSTPYDAYVTSVDGYHVYLDVWVSQKLSIAESKSDAEKLLRVIDEITDIASTSATVDDIWLFEVQGLRIHVFVDASQCNAVSVGRLLAFASYMTKSIDKRVRRIAGDDYQGTCMAAAHGHAVVLSTGREGDDSLISFGDAANRPAKRLGRDDISDGHLVIPMDVANQSPLLEATRAQQSGNTWCHIDVLHGAFPNFLSKEEVKTLEALVESLTPDGTANRIVNFAATIDGVVNLEAGTVREPTVANGLVFRADLHGFTKRVEEASMRGDQALQAVVGEFLLIMQIPDAFEKVIGQPATRLPWAGDCYNAVFFLKNGQQYRDLRENVLPITCLRWHDPDGQVNSTRSDDLRKIAVRQQWSVGVSGGDNAGRVLLANVQTPHRQFMVAAGWAVKHSFEAQNTSGLGEGESAVHHEDHAQMCQPFKDTFDSWDGGRGYRKAAKENLGSAAAEEVKKLTAEKVVGSVTAPHIQVSSRPYCG